VSGFAGFAGVPQRHPTVDVEWLRGIGENRAVGGWGRSVTICQFFVTGGYRREKPARMDLLKDFFRTVTRLSVPVRIEVFRKKLPSMLTEGRMAAEETICHSKR
jgi:hypothetical protein